MEKGVDNFHSVPARLLSELCALQSCDRLCDDIITDFSREPAVLLQTSFPHHQPGLLGAYFQHGIGGIGHNFPVATHPAHSSALGQRLPYSASGRYGTPGNPLRVPGNLRQHQADGAGMTSVLNSSAHAGGGGVRRKRDSQLHSTINGQGIVPKRAAAQCMIYSCQNLSEPCKRKLKLCAEHKVRKTQVCKSHIARHFPSHSNTYVSLISTLRGLHRCDCMQMALYSATAGIVTSFMILTRSLRMTCGLFA